MVRQNKQTTVSKTATPVSILRNSANDQDIAEICKQAKLQGKEFWYFVAPSDALVSVAHNLEISMDEARQGNSVISHKGEDYGVTLNSVTPKSTIQVVLPSAELSQYQVASRQPDQVVQFKRLPQLKATSTTGPASKPKARPQPAVLNARFTPIGVYDPAGQSRSVDEPDTVMDDAPPAPVASIKKEKVAGKDKSKGKGKAKVEDAVTPGPASTPAKKRKLTAASEEDAEAASQQLLGETQMAETNAKKLKTERQGSFDLGSEPRPSATKDASASTPASKSKSKKSKKAEATPAQPASQAPTSAAKQTPIPLPRQTAVPLPTMFGSSHKNSPVPLPQLPPSSSVPLPTPSKAEKPKKDKSSKGKDKDGKKKEKKTAAQSAASTKAETPVPPPVIRGMD